MSASKELFSNPLANYEAFSTYGSFNAQMARIKDMVDRQESITAKVDEYNDIHTDLSNTDVNPNYKDYNFTKADGKIWLDYVDRKSDVKDAAKEDVRTMIIEQNNAYIIGMVTLATVLVTTFLVLK
jgi:hypothetical protein